MRLSRLEPLLALGVVFTLVLLSGALAALVRAAQPAPETAAAATLGTVLADGPARAAAAAVPPGPTDVPPQHAVRTVVATQPAEPVLCVRAKAGTATNGRWFVTPAPGATATNPCDTYVAECPAGSFPSGAFGVCTKNCKFGDPVPVREDCPPEPTKPCEFGDPVPVGKTCPPEPTKPCEFGDRVPISQDCPPEPAKSCQFGSPVPISQDCPPEPTKPCEFGDRVPISQDCPDQPMWNCEFGDRVPISQNCPPEPTKTCSNGVVTGLGDPCPQQTATCPNGAIVATGEGCPEKSVYCPSGQVVAAGVACPAPITACPGGVRVPEGRSCPPPPCPLQASPSVTGCEPARTTPTAVSPAGQLMPLPESGKLVLDKATVTGADALYAHGAGCEPGSNVVLTTKGHGGTVEVVGQSTADADGQFEAAVQFASLHAGYREVTANCDTLLVSGVDMVLTSSASPTSRTYLLLVFFLLVGSLIVRFQVGEARSVRRR